MSLLSFHSQSGSRIRNIIIIICAHSVIKTCTRNIFFVIKLLVVVSGKGSVNYSLRFGKHFKRNSAKHGTGTIGLAKLRQGQVSLWFRSDIKHQFSLPVYIIFPVEKCQQTVPLKSQTVLSVKGTVCTFSSPSTGKTTQKYEKKNKTGSMTKALTEHV